MVPVTVFRVWLTGDQLDARMVVGTLVALMGVLVIALLSTAVGFQASVAE